MTRGQRLLLAAVTALSGAEVAARAMVPPSRVSEWLSGKRAPNAAHREMLCKQFGIPADCWCDISQNTVRRNFPHR